MDKDKFTEITAQVVVGCITLLIVAVTVWVIIWLFT